MTHALIAAGLAALAFVNPAHADTRTVSYADLDLSTAHGRTALEARVRGAARQVCEIGAEQLTLSEQIAANACVTHAVASAHQQFASIEARRSQPVDRLR